MNDNTYTAWNIGTEQTPCYVTVMDANEIFKLSKVSRVDEDVEEGYQRVLSAKRASDIADYLDEGNIIPGSIILSAQNGFDVDFDTTTNQLTLKPNNGLLFVIDGQHRLWGASKSKQKVLMPVCIFTNLELRQEVQYFLDINSNQKGVPKTLRLELLKFLSEPDTKEDILIRLFSELGSEVDSPLFGRTSPTKFTSGKITHVPFHKALEPLVEDGTLKKFEYKDKKVLLINYLESFEELLISIEGSSKRLTNSAFFQAIFKIFEVTCEYSLSYFKNYKKESFDEILDGIKSIDLSKYDGSNQQTINSLSSEMSSLLEIHIRKFNTPDDLL